MTPAQAAQTADSLGLYIQYAGNPDLTEELTVSLQEPKAGTQVEPGSIIQLTFTDPRFLD